MMRRWWRSESDADDGISVLMVRTLYGNIFVEVYPHEVDDAKTEIGRKKLYFKMKAELADD